VSKKGRPPQNVGKPHGREEGSKINENHTTDNRYTKKLDLRSFFIHDGGKMGEGCFHNVYGDGEGKKQSLDRVGPVG